MEEGTTYFLCLIASTLGGTLDLMVQRVTGLASPPSGIATGDGAWRLSLAFPMGHDDDVGGSV